jgi:hypothetical protein
MSSTTSYRLSGIALIIGAVLSIIYYLTQSFLNGNDLATLTSPLTLMSNVIGFIGSVLVLLGLPGVYARQAKRAGILGLLGFLFLWYVTLYQGVIIPFTSITIVPELATNPATRTLATTPPPAFGPFFLVSMVGEILGILLLAIATLRAKVFPRWIGWLLIATLVAGVVNFVPFFPEAFSSLPAIIGSVAIAGFGYALLSPQRGEAVQSVSASAAAESRA